MLKKIICLFVVMVLLAGGVFAFDATRTVTSNSVSIAINTAGTTGYIVDETIPNGVIPSNIGQGGSYNSDLKIIRWTKLDNAIASLTYSYTGSGVVSGTITGGNPASQKTISGNTQLGTSSPPDNPPVQVENDLMVNYVRGRIIIDGVNASAGTQYKIEVLDGLNKGYKYDGQVGGQKIYPNLKGNGYFDTGDNIKFNTGEKFKVSIETYGCNQEGTFVNGGNGDFNTGQGLIILDCKAPAATPQISSISDKEIMENDLLEFVISATDANAGDTLTLTANNLPSGANFVDNGNRTADFSWQTGLSDAGTYKVEFIVSDGKLQDKKIIMIVVKDFNFPPVINPIDDITVEEDSGFKGNISLSASDVDGTIKKFEIYDENKNEVDCSITDAKFGIKPAPNFAGTATCIIRVYDNLGAYDETTVKIIVNNINDAPIIKNFSPKLDIVMAGDKSKNFEIAWEDSDSDPAEISVIWYLDGTQVGFGESYSFQSSEINDYELKVEVKDSTATATKKWNIKTTNVPIMSNYNGATTTFPSGTTDNDLMSFQNFILEILGIGKIEYLEAVDLRDVIDLNTYAKISKSGIGIDDNQYPSLNKKARISFYNLGFSKTPVIYYNSNFVFSGGIVCPDNVCSNISYKNNNLVFDVSHMSTFRVEDAQTCAKQGGKICSATETCSGTALFAGDTNNCCAGSCIRAPPKFEEDIDVCEKINSELKVEIKEPDNNEDFEPGETIGVDVKIKNPAEENIKFNVEAYLFNINQMEVENDRDDRIKIKDGDSETISLDLKIDEDIDADEDYAVFVKVYDRNDEEIYCNQDYVEINIERPKHKVILKNINIGPEIVDCGRSVYVDFDVENIGQNNEDVYVTMKNSALGISEKTSEFELEEAGEDDLERKNFRFTIPTNVDSGNYRLDIEAKYDGESDRESKTISVRCGNDVSQFASNKGGIITLNYKPVTTTLLKPITTLKEIVLRPKEYFTLTPQTTTPKRIDNIVYAIKPEPSEYNEIVYVTPKTVDNIVYTAVPTKVDNAIYATEPISRLDYNEIVYVTPRTIDSGVYTRPIGYGEVIDVPTITRSQNKEIENWDDAVVWSGYTYTDIATVLLILIIIMLIIIIGVVAARKK